MIRQHSSVIRLHSSVIRHGRHVVSQCPKQKYFPPVLVAFFHIPGDDFLCLTIYLALKHLKHWLAKIT